MILENSFNLSLFIVSRVLKEDTADNGDKREERERTETASTTVDWGWDPSTYTR